MEGSASIGATQSAVMRSSRFRSSHALLNDRVSALGIRVHSSCWQTLSGDD